MRSLILALATCVALAQAGTYTDRFLTQYNKIKDTNNGYWSSEGIPYHSVETLIVEAPDYGHQTTSETYSYWVYMEAVYGAIKGDFEPFNDAWASLENNIIPKLQPYNNNYNPSKPATFSEEKDDPSQYPSQMEFGVPVGQDPIYQELVSAYGNADIYGMHWLLDTDNKYGFGNPQGMCEEGPGETGASFINNYQRGPMESVWKTVPQSTCDKFTYGGSHGFLDLFVGDNSYTQQWKYSNAPDADSRAVQATYWALQWAKAAGKDSTITESLNKAAKIGDYLRYSMFDKYFKRIGNCVGPYNCPGGQGKESCHYLISWYYAWGAALYGGWGWRIGEGAAHVGYQNPMTAYALSQIDALKPKSATGASDWAISLDRQIELYEYLQTEEGAFAGGVTNTWKGRYDNPTTNLTKDPFHGMWYDWEPVYHNPPSNRWFGWQSWSVDRLAQYYYVTGNDTVKNVMEKWVNWVLPLIKFENGDYSIPGDLQWSGVPPKIDVTVAKYSQDVGAASSLARTLAYYAAKSGDTNAKSMAKKLLDAIWNHAGTKGVDIVEEMDTYGQFNGSVYVPPGWTGKYPYGDIIDSSATFIGIRSWYKQDPDWPKVEAYLNGGEVPKMTYHRFWAQADVAISNGIYGLLFNE